MKLPTEDQEAIALTGWLRQQRVNGVPVRFIHVPNEGARSAAGNAIARAKGLQPGFPDYLILTPTAKAPRGAFVELKRRHSGKRSEMQIAWAHALVAELGIVGGFANGAREAVRMLCDLGYGIFPNELLVRKSDQA